MEIVVNNSFAPAEVLEKFDSMEKWNTWREQNKNNETIEYIERVANSIKTNGITEPLTENKYPASAVITKSNNYRETFRAGTLISRQRAVLKSLAHMVASDEIALTRHTRIYAPEALTEFAMFMRGRYPLFLGSEFAPTQNDRKRIYPIPHQDLQKLTFDDHAFELIISNDVFEHIPNLDMALRECSRILSNNGTLVATFPFAYNKENSMRKAILTDQKIDYLTAPEYHGNPMDPTGGSLVFEVPAWDILERARSAGFKESYFFYVSSQKHGILAKDSAGVFVFVAKNG